VIHPTAIIDPNAQIGKDVSVGPFSVIGPDVIIGDGTTVGPHVVINGHTTIGTNNQIFQFASIGEANQDKKYAGEPTTTVIGNNNVFRESCTIHRGTIQDRGETTIGDDNLFMAYVHVAHDCVIKNHCIFANHATIAGHVHVGNHVIMGGFTGVHQFCQIGDHSFTAISSVIVKDIPPFVMADGQSARPRGLNKEGMRRRGFSKEEITSINQAYKLLYREGLTTQKAIEAMKPQAEEFECVAMFREFIINSNRGVIR
jgi:UDP-N-acetylglucosamine acyltransferase